MDLLTLMVIVIVVAIVLSAVGTRGRGDGR
jgi:hypothetical protein